MAIENASKAPQEGADGFGEVGGWQSPAPSECAVSSAVLWGRL